MAKQLVSRAGFVFCSVALAAFLSSCSGGGGGGNTGGSGTIPPITPTNPPITFSATGTVVEFSMGTPIAGATITLGTIPTTGTGWASFGSPLSPCATCVVTTAADGTFTITGISASGNYMLTVSKDAAPTTTQTYAILHRTATLSASPVTTALGTLRIALLSNDERAWIARLNVDRATIAVPATGPAVVDEYAQEQARQWAIDVDAGTTPYTDAGYAPYQTAYGAKPGSIGSAGGALDLNDTWQDAEAIWFAEKANCPGGDWRTCTFSGTTGHYINLAQDSVVWVGVGEDLAGHYGSDLTTHGFDVMTIYKGSTARTASSVIRAIAY